MGETCSECARLRGAFRRNRRFTFLAAAGVIVAVLVHLLFPEALPGLAVSGSLRGWLPGVMRVASFLAMLWVSWWLGCLGVERWYMERDAKRHHHEDERN